MLTLFKSATEFVFNLFKESDNNLLVYHNYQHSLKVITASTNALKDAEISSSKSSIIQLALLFSNTGFLKNYASPYEESMTIAQQFFSSKDLEPDTITAILNSIKAIETKAPKNKVEEYVIDCYYYKLGTKGYLKNSKLLKKEIELNSKNDIKSKAWIKQQVKLLTEHRYFTKYAVDNWQDRKQKNLRNLIEEQSSTKKSDKKEKLKAFYKVKYKNESPERGIQTLYRVALRNHIKLSDIADTKANILLSVNAIIISMVLANLISKLDNPSNRYLILPTIIFVTFSVISMIMSIKATQPNVTRGKFTKEDIKNKSVNLAFFGNFHKMDYSNYEAAINNLLKNKEDVYNTLTKDLYFLGLVLDSKYRLLRYTYYVFMTGIIGSVIAFALAFIYRNVLTL